MSAVPPLDDANTSFDRYDANAPFCIDPDATNYNGGTDELEVVVGPGRARFGSGSFELTADQTTYTFASPAASTTYYAYIDYNFGAAVVAISTTAPFSESNPDLTYIGSVTTAGDKSVSGTSDERGLLPLSSPRFSLDGSASDPSLSWFLDLGTGLFRAGNNIIGFTTDGTERMRLGTSNLLLTAVGLDLNGNAINDVGSLDVDNLTLNGQTLSSNIGIVFDVDGDIQFQTDVDGTVAQWDQSFGGWRFWDDGGEVVRIGGGNLEMEAGGAIITNGGGINLGGGDLVAIEVLQASTNLIVETDGGSVHTVFDNSGSTRTLRLGGESNDWIGYDPIVEEFEFVTQGNAILQVGASGVFTGDPRLIGFQDYTAGPSDYLSYDDGSNQYDFYADGAISNSEARFGSHTNVSDARIKENITPFGSVRHALREHVQPIRWNRNAADGPIRYSPGTAQQWQEAFGEEWAGVSEGSDGMLAIYGQAVESALLAYCHDLSDALDEAVARIATLEDA